jgi:transposase
MFEYRQILVRLRQGDTDRDIARAGLMGRRKTAAVRKLAQARGWLDPDGPLPDDATLAAALAAPPTRSSNVSTLEPHRARIKHWWADGVQGTTIHAALKRNHGYTGSYSAVRRLLQQLAATEPVAATTRLDFAPGEAAQVDFGAGPLIVDRATGELRKSWFFVMTLCFSRHQYAELVRDQTVATWLACHRRAFEWFGGVPARIIIDNAKCAIVRACWHEPVVQRAYAACAEGYGFRIAACPPRDPQKKGIVEAGVKYVKKGFVPLRTFRGLADANGQLRAWVIDEAGERCHGTTRQKPLVRFALERDLLIALPDVAPELATWAQVRVHRDAHVQFDKALYSVPFGLIGERLWLKASPTTVTVYAEHQQVATHGRQQRPGARSTVRDHLPPAAAAYRMRDPQWCLAQAGEIGPACHGVIEALFADRVLDNLRAAQGVLRLAGKYTAERLEAACERALAFGEPRYRTVKTILAKGLDQATPPAPAEATTTTYTQGGRFCRDARTLLTH